ncbi:cytochrome b N-terminal domain-containing protein [Planctomycetes bacterium TBK1r]|uniref:Cytochrome b/c1 n=1 Tax=Stieleria magnilauensis TaxID=2527963 RepID=A0ABX5XVR6_9BACT|nr:Cytochrome b/c1 [Planctomycetes bacterium TBK1r]
MSIIKSIIGWIDNRMQLSDSVVSVARHPIPAEVAQKKGWWYVFGSVTMTFFMLQVVTGICLAMVYEPTADAAYSSLQTLNYQTPFGWLIRAIHYYAATGMVVMIVVHMTQVFLMGAYKYPREVTWFFGVGLLGLTLALAFSGQVLRFDSSSYWGVGVLASAAGRAPAVGPEVVHTVLGGQYIGESTVGRFFAVHVFILPALLVTLLAGHLYMVIKRGISEPPKPEQPVDPATYDEQYEELLKKGVPFFPHAIYRDGIACAIAVIVVVALAVIFGPKGPDAFPDPTIIGADPRPDWYFLPMFALAALCPPSLEFAFIIVAPVIAIGVLLAVPFLSGSGERSASRRPVAVMFVTVTYIVFAVLGWYGATSPWSPQMDAWSGDPVPVEMVKHSSPLELQGAVTFQLQACRNCHALDGVGGKRGPDLTYVGSRKNRPELIRQVVQGGGYMPAYGQQLSAAEIDALVAFLAARRPAGEPEAKLPVAPPIKGDSIKGRAP